jgi:hypothetical protein
MTDRNIHVQKGWERPTTSCLLVPNWVGEFCDFNDWVNSASRRLTVASDSNGMDLSPICVDTQGRRCHNGRDFMRARDEGTFPVRYFFDCILAAQGLPNDPGPVPCAGTHRLRPGKQ